MFFLETLQHRRKHQSLIMLYRYLHNNGLKYIKDFFASEKLNVIYFIYTEYSHCEILSFASFFKV